MSEAQTTLEVKDGEGEPLRVAITLDARAGTLKFKAADDDALRDFFAAMERDSTALVDWWWAAIERARAN
jgi:hypothetical protein